MPTLNLSKNPNQLNKPTQINQDWFMRHKWFFAAIVFVIVGAGIIFQIQTDYRRRNIDTSSPAHVVKDQPAQSQVSDPRLTTDGWYIHEPLGFQIKIPNDVKIQSEHNDEYNRLTHFKGPELDFEVRLRDYSGSIENYIFLEGETSQKGTVDGKQAVILKSDGYCDGPGCGSAYVNNAVKAKPDGDVYNIIFYGDKVMSAQESQILSTFKFIDNLSSYTNLAYGYSFDYPKDWMVSDNSKDAVFMEIGPSISSTTGGIMTFDLACIWAVDGFEDPIVEKKKVVYGPNTYDNEKTYRMVNGKKTLVIDMYSINLPASVKSKGYMGNAVYFNNCPTASFIVRSQDFSKEVLQILSSFKFTK